MNDEPNKCPVCSRSLAADDRNDMPWPDGTWCLVDDDHFYSRNGFRYWNRLRPTFAFGPGIGHGSYPRDLSWFTRMVIVQLTPHTTVYSAIGDAGAHERARFVDRDAEGLSLYPISRFRALHGVTEMRERAMSIRRDLDARYGRLELMR